MINISALKDRTTFMQEFKGGEIIIQDGDKDTDKMYIVLDGSVGVYKDYMKDEQIDIAVLYRGDFFGEMSLFLNAPRTATVVALEDTELLVINRATAHEFFRKEPDATYTLIQALCQRVTNSNLAYKVAQDIKIASQLDALTKLYNRGAFFEKFIQSYNMTMLNQQSGCVMMTDLDYFKKVNDTYGHPAGDIVLVTVADLLKSQFQKKDCCGRYGGEEFIVWIPGDSIDTVAPVAESVRELIELFPIDTETKQGEINITISIGVAAIDYSRPCTASELISKADAALYAAKQSGRNRVCVFDWSSCE
ncbi:MAG: GGDEF domain-containing protein [Clostridiales bacterium]|jgi:diguanylate cyclase (GGDEF)-like protein|nr:GGDEF domain-containing protein [Clostridiales bacterium]